MTTPSFVELNLSAPICRALAEEKYVIPTPIQAGAIPHLLAGRDLLGCAQTGTGKTAAFALPILHQLDTSRRPAQRSQPQILVLSPTRELAVQISESFATYGRHVRFRQTVVYGGVSQQGQVRALERGVHVVIATPGRLLDLTEQGRVDFSQVKTFVLDEADRMLDMGFLPDLKRIIAQLPKVRQSLFFSATMPPKVAELAASLLQNPERVTVTPPASTVDLIDQRVMFVPSGKKSDLLLHLISEQAYRRVLIFSRTKHGADKLTKQLCKNGLKADAIHGNKSQNARERTLARFRSGSLQVLVATDVAARGIDIDGISHVINFDLPHDPESYVHRIGRTGRAGATGEAVLFCDPSERGGLRAIERLTRRSIAVDHNHPFVAAGSHHDRSQASQDSALPAAGDASPGVSTIPSARAKKPRVSKYGKFAKSGAGRWSGSGSGPSTSGPGKSSAGKARPGKSRRGPGAFARGKKKRFGKNKPAAVHS